MRYRTQLTAGRLHKRHGRRHRRHKLTRRPLVKLGHPVKIKGRLTVARGKHRRGLAGQRLLVYRRVRVQGARYKRVGQLVTGKRGRAGRSLCAQSWRWCGTELLLYARHKSRDLIQHVGDASASDDRDWIAAIDGHD